jgi:hypothetical protein
MAVNFKVKNTFLELESDATQTTSVATAHRRSASVPRVFKPGSCLVSVMAAVIVDDSYTCTPCSDDSTNASDQDVASTCDDSSPISDASSQSGSNTCEDCLSDHEALSWFKMSDGCSDDSNGTGSSAGRVALNLADMVCVAAKPCKTEISLVDLCTTRSKLRSSARLFRSARDPPEEVNALISCAAETFRHGNDVMDVQVQNGGMGGTTMIVAQSCSMEPDASMIFPFIKDALLTASAQSEKTYIMGYNVRPFNDLDSLSFSMNVACVPDAHENTACWETYENGICPRQSCCRWDHPAELDMMRVIVTLKKMEW